MAVIFTLKGRDLEVVFTMGGGADLPTLNYRQGMVAKCFQAQQVELEETTLGKLVTVKIDDLPDTATTFAIFLPAIETPLLNAIDFTTIGMYKELRGPSITPGRPATGWRSVQLYGIAQTSRTPSTQIFA